MGLNLLLADSGTTAALAPELRALGHRVTVAGDGREALCALDDDQFDAIVLDALLPRIDGTAPLRLLRSAGATLPVVMIGARIPPAETIAALDAGADEYLGEPVAIIELDARLRALVRARRWGVGSGDTLRAGDIVINAARFRVWRDGVPIALARLEYKLLLELVRGADAVLTRAILLERVWGYDAPPATNIVDVQIRYLRAKLMAGGGGDPIVTVRGVGYMIRR